MQGTGDLMTALLLGWSNVRTGEHPRMFISRHGFVVSNTWLIGCFACNLHRNILITSRKRQNWQFPVCRYLSHAALYYDLKFNTVYAALYPSVC
jgi:hypothetical protein